MDSFLIFLFVASIFVPLQWPPLFLVSLWEMRVRDSELAYPDGPPTHNYAGRLLPTGHDLD